MTQVSISTPLSNFIEQQTKGFLCYSESWYNLLQSVYGYSIILLTTTDRLGQIKGILPLCEIKSPLTGHRLVSLPFSDCCPLLASDEDSANDLIDQAIRLAQEKKVKYLELRPGVNDVLAKRSDMVAGNLYVRWLLPLQENPDALWTSLSSHVRRHIHKAQKQDIQIRMAENIEDVEQYYRLHLLTRSKKHGMPAQPRKYFYQLWNDFHAEGKVQIFLAEYHEHVIASIVIFVHDEILQCAYAASDQRFLHLSPNHLLYWSVIKWGCTQQYKAYDFGRTAIDNKGLMEFKRRWGAIEEPLPYYYYPGVAGLASKSEDSKLFRLLTSCWRRLPLSVAGPLGGLVYRHMG